MKSKYYWAAKNTVLGRIEPIIHIIYIENGQSFSFCGERSKFGFKEPEILSGVICCEDCFSQITDSDDFHYIRQFRINHNI